MLVISTGRERMGQDNHPEWSGLTNAGMFRVPPTNGGAGCHCHDCDEY